MAPIPPAPAALENGDRLVGEVLFQLKVSPLSRMAVDIYNVAFYVDAPAAAVALRPFAGRAHEDLRADAAYFKRLTKGRFRRTHYLTMARSVPAMFMQMGWRHALGRYAGADCAAEMSRVISMVPSLAAHDTLAVRFDADGESFQLSKNGGPPLGSTRSRELWLAFQRIYFDEDTEAPPEIKTGVVQHLPEVLWGGAATPGGGPPAPAAAEREARVRAPETAGEAGQEGEEKAPEQQPTPRARAERKELPDSEEDVLATRAEAERAAAVVSLGTERVAREREVEEAAKAAAAREVEEAARRGHEANLAHKRKRTRQAAVAAFLKDNGFSGVDLPRRQGGCGIIPMAKTTYALHCAAEMGNAKMVEMLLLEGASVSQVSSSGQTAAQAALTAQRRGGKGSFSEVLRVLDLRSTASQRSLGGA